MLNNYAKVLDYFSFFQTGFNPREQQGVVRTNCLDCLDRTNSLQMNIAWRTLKSQLLQHGVDSEMYFKTDSHPLLAKFKKLWQKSGNKLSIQYAGTGAIVKGNKGLLDAVNNKFKTVNRFFKGNLSDDFKQNCISFLLDRKTFSNCCITARRRYRI